MSERELNMFLGSEDSEELKSMKDIFAGKGYIVAEDTEEAVEKLIQAGVDIGDLTVRLTGGLLSICIADTAIWLLSYPRDARTNISVVVDLSNSRLDWSDKEGSEPSYRTLQRRFDALFKYRESLLDDEGLTVTDHTGRNWHQK